MNNHAIFDSPTFYGNRHRYYSKGSSPRIFNFLRKWIHSKASDIEEVFVAVYLFNNEYLHDELLALVARGVRVHLVTIPPDGYDTAHPQMIFDKSERKDFFKKPHTKYSLAKRIFSKHFQSSIENFDLYFFPHKYLRSHRVRPFSRGKQPFSMHLKSFLFLMKNGEGVLGLSSSNLAVRDTIKEENFLMTDIKNDKLRSNHAFFKTLFSHAIKIQDFDFENNYHHLEFLPQKIEQNPNVFFTAPFFFNSPFQAENFLKQAIDQAQKRIFIAAQHISCYKYFLEGKFHSQTDNQRVMRDGFLKNVLRKANEGIEVRFLSQTFAGDLGIEKKARKIANSSSFRTFLIALEESLNIKYSVNKNLHSKYIIIDDLVIVTTCNFTPSQFIYLDKVEIPKFEKMPGESYSGIFSEVSQFVKVTEPKIVESYVRNFEEICQRKESHQVAFSRNPTP